MELNEMLGIVISAIMACLLLADKAAADSGTQWIWETGPRHEERTASLHREFSLTGPVNSATLRCVADFCDATVYVNGKRVAEAENFGPLVRVDVARHLELGVNILALKCLGLPGPSAVAIELAMRLDGEPGQRTQRIVSDSTWLNSASKPCAAYGPVDFRYWDQDAKDVAIRETDDYTQWKQALGAAPGADPAAFQVPDGFEIERIRAAGEDEGSWISLEFDPRGRLIIAREDKGLLRLTLDKNGSVAGRLETINDTLKECRGLLWAFDSLYANANESKGLYRLRDTNGDGRFDEVKLLYASSGGTGHGRNDLALGPDNMIYSIHGDAVDLPDPKGKFAVATSPFREHAKGAKTREGHLIRTDRDGRRWEVVASGLRNPFGIDFNPYGDIFTYDADAEYDMGAPWYRPTRVNHLVSGGDYRWRGVTRSWPPYYPDRSDAAPFNLNIGKGSPTAVKFGTNSRFPPAYQRALFVLDWAYGRILAVHLLPRGASYLGRAEVFARGRPLNVTDLDFGPDGAMYFVTGGRKTRSALYRIRYAGAIKRHVEPLHAQRLARGRHAIGARELRRKLEAFHGRQDKAAVEFAWPHLESPEPWIRHAARIAVEHQPIDAWGHVTCQIALARGDENDQLPAVLDWLNAMPLENLSSRKLLMTLDAYSICLTRRKKPDTALTQAAAEKLNRLYPASDAMLNQRLSTLLVQLDAPDAVPKTLELLKTAASQPEQLHYLFILTRAKSGWSPERRRVYFQWLARMNTFRGGEGMPTFVKRIRADAVAALDKQVRESLAPIIAKFDRTRAAPPPPDRPFVREWKLAELAGSLGEVTKDRNFRRGKSMFSAALCNRCHRLGHEGTPLGPDLTSLSRRFSRRDMLESILSPSKVVAEQYRTSRLITTDGRSITGRIVPSRDYRSANLRIETDPLDPAAVVEIPKQHVEQHETTRLSFMPQGLLNTLSRQEILDLLAYVESGGREDHPCFQTMK